MVSILNIYSRYVAGVNVNLYGIETFLLDDNTYCPNLKSLELVGYLKNDQLLLCSLFSKYSQTLKNLSLKGDCSDCKLQGCSITSLESLRIENAWSRFFRRVLKTCAHTITTLELINIRSSYSENHNNFNYAISNLRHLCIISNNINLLPVFLHNAPNLESLVATFNVPPREDIHLFELPNLTKLKLLEVNLPLVLTSILLKCSQNLEVLYVPRMVDEMPQDEAMHLPALTDLCVSCDDDWGCSMVEMNCKSLKFLAVYTDREIKKDNTIEETEDEHSDTDDQENNEVSKQMKKNPVPDENIIADEDTNEETSSDDDSSSDNPGSDYSDFSGWPKLSDIDCQFPRLELLLLPGCAASTTLCNIASKCPETTPVSVQKDTVAAKIAARINFRYGYKNFVKMMHPYLKYKLLNYPLKKDQTDITEPFYWLD